MRVGLRLALAASSIVVASCIGSRTGPPAAQPPRQSSTPAIPSPEDSVAPHPPSIETAPDDLLHGDPDVRIRLFHGVLAITVRTTDALHIEHEKGRLTLDPGNWQIRLVSANPPFQQFHLFGKTFQIGREPERDAYIAEWRAKGFAPEVIVMGNRYRGTDQQTLDVRQYWISLDRAGSLIEAQRIKKRLEPLGAWAWIRPETLEAGNGSANIVAQSGHVAHPLPIPFGMSSRRPIHLSTGTDAGQSYSGTIDIAVGDDSRLAAFETLSLEEYLAGVLPAEMPALWPHEALKAQAITARSDVLYHLGYKHVLEGFHFTNSEGDRVYAGFGGRHAATDAAVRETRGRVLIRANRIVPAVFSSNCGGWTEDNDAVWSGPPDESLRGVSDLKTGTANPSLDVVNWLQLRPPAYCGEDSNGYRWTRRFTAEQLDQLVNKVHPVGQIRSIETGERGVSGRLKWVRVVGSRGTATIEKELPIRQVFGGLPSAMVIIKSEPGPNGPSAWTFIGGGRGHGVGLCQHGARGLALEGAAGDAIVRHYFPGATLETLR
ncbi:MAG: hypothetical protein AMXMBFR4_15990 [Candidatus Hydrogenedentota bacterium]